MPMVDFFVTDPAVGQVPSEHRRRRHDLPAWRRRRLVVIDACQAAAENVLTAALTKVMTSRENMTKPPRLTFAGYCVYCTNRWCQRVRCKRMHRRSAWRVCSMCDGFTVRQEDGGLACVCSFGLEPVPEINNAGDQQWC